MVDVIRSTIVDAPIESVWDVLRDFNGHDRWHPAVAESRIADGVQPDAVGAVRDFRLRNGAHLREQLLALSDRDHRFSYCILEAPFPLLDYVATVRLQPVTDGNRTFWEWRSRFNPPKKREAELSKLVGEDIYEAGFRAIKQMLRGGGNARHVPVPNQEHHPGPAPLPQAGSITRAIVMTRHGGPEVLEPRKQQVPPPGPGELRIRQRAIGINYIDVYTRTGYFNLVSPPGVPGMEASGVVEGVGPDVADWHIGDRVAYACLPPGAYCDLRTMKTDLLVRTPEFLADEQAAASLLKGITASVLLHDVHALKSGETVLIHAAAGGVGLILCQWAKAMGATVIGTTSTDEKAARAIAAGCDHVVNYSREDFAEAVLNLTGGRGADVIYDAVGRDTFEASLRCLRTCGHLVSFGQASGDIGVHDIGRLAAKSATLSRPNYAHYTETAEAMRLQSGRFFEAVRTGHIIIGRPASYALADAAAAHRAIESRSSIGAIVLIP